MNHPDVARLLSEAAFEQRSGRAASAAAKLRQLLSIAPDNPQALNSLGVMALASGDVVTARDYLGRAIAADPAEPALRLNLAKAHRLAEDDEAERAALEGALSLDRRNFMALVRMAELHERLGEDAQAVGMWQGVLAMAPMLPQRSAAVDGLVAHATGFVGQRGAAFAEAIEAALADRRAGLDWDQRRRFDAAIGQVVGRRRIYRNECEGLYFPMLPADEFFPRWHFEWLARAEAATDAVRAELEAVLAAEQGLVPYVSQPVGMPANKWSPLDKSPDWSAYYLSEFGDKRDEACAACPATAALLESLPQADIPGRAPTAFFSILRPHTRIPAHTGVSNTRAIVHLPLIVPQGCGFRVGGETREWRVGEAFAFDDTIEHEAWNDSGELRAVLIFDVWNPHLSEVERGLLRDFYRAADASGHNPEPRH